MTVSAALLISSLVIVVTLPFLILLIWKMRQEEKSKETILNLHRVESLRVQTLLNLMIARDFPTFAGLQNLSQQQSQVQVSNGQLNQTISNSEYIPRDDITEALRLRNFGTGIGYGELILDTDEGNEDLVQMVSDMIGDGQVDFGEGGIK